MRIEYGLAPGDRLTIVPRENGLQTRDEDHKCRIRKCIVIREYPRYILADFGKYRECINKASIYCRAVLIWKGWEDL